MYDLVNSIEEDILKKTAYGKVLKEQLKEDVSAGILSESQAEEYYDFKDTEYAKHKNDLSRFNNYSTTYYLLEHNPHVLDVRELYKYGKEVRKIIIVMYEEEVEKAKDIFDKYNAQYEEIDRIDIDPQIKGRTCVVFKIIDTKTVNKTGKDSLEYNLRCSFSAANITAYVHYYELLKESRGKYTLRDMTESIWRLNPSDKKELSKGGGYRKDIKREVKSSWEANFIRVLNLWGFAWEYEKESIQLAHGYYIPDFTLRDKKDFVFEVKGWFDARSLKHISALKKEYPNKILKVIDNDIMYVLERVYGKDISGWEKGSYSKGEIIPVVGITRNNRTAVRDNLKDGDRLLLVREKNNSYDRNAIKVCNEANEQLGYVSADWACVLAPKIDYGFIYTSNITSIDDKVIKVNIRCINLDEIKDVRNFLEL